MVKIHAERLETFFGFKIRESDLHNLKQKMLQFAEYEKERLELGIDRRISVPKSTLNAEQEDELVRRLEAYTAAAGKVLKKEEEMETLVKKETEHRNEHNVGVKRAPSRWPIIGIFVIYMVYTIRERCCR